MNDFLKKGFWLGIGAAITSKEKLEENINRLVQKGMMTRTEADSLFNDFLKKGEEKSESWNEEFRKTIKIQLKEFGFVTTEELDSLQSQITLLQEEIKLLRHTKSTTENTDTNNEDKSFVRIDKADEDLY